MNSLEKLIAKHCPVGVEHRPVGDVCIIQRGERITKSNLTTNGKYDVISGGVGPLGRYDQYNRKGGTITISQYGTAGYVAWQAKCFWANDVCYTVKLMDGVIPRYVYFVLLSMQNEIYSKVRTDAVPSHLPREALEKLMLPVPPLPVQQEIVRMLDDMTGLISAIEEEIEARKKQYVWCRDKMLKLDGVERKTLGEMCEYSACRIKASCVSAHTYVSVESILQDRQGRIDSQNVPVGGNVIAFHKGDVLVGNIRPYLKKIWLADVDGGTNGDVLVFCRKKPMQIDSEYLYHVLSTDEFFSYDMQYAKGAKMPRGDKAAIMKYQIRVPPLSTQKKIASKLNEMMRLIAALEEELVARKQQYEYYRDKLLNFKRKGGGHL